jgi:hypothetical protein
MSWLAGSQSIFTADWCLLHQSSCLRIWLEHSQSLDVCNEFFRIASFGFNMSALSRRT